MKASTSCKLLHRETLFIRTPQGQSHVSALQRHPYYKGRNLVTLVSWPKKSRNCSLLRRPWVLLNFYADSQPKPLKSKCVCEELDAVNLFKIYSGKASSFHTLNTSWACFNVEIQLKAQFHKLQTREVSKVGTAELRDTTVHKRKSRSIRTCWSN